VDKQVLLVNYLQS